MPDGGLFDFPNEVPAPAAIATPEAAAGQLVWLTMPAGRTTRAKSARPGGKRGAIRRRRRTRDRLHVEFENRGGGRSRLSAPRLRNPQDVEAGLCGSADRPHRRSARPDDRVRREVCAAGARVRGPSDGRRAGSTASSAGSATSSTNSRATRPTRPRAADCKAPTT